MTFDEWYEINKNECYALAREDMVEALRFAWDAGNALEVLVDNITEWHHNRNLIEGSTDQAQFVKLTEEIGELAADIARGRDPADSMADILVVVINIATRNGLTIEKCLEIGWDEIKDRRGRMVDGIFIKEGDDGQV